jgi:hypothetical protein
MDRTAASGPVQECTLSYLTLRLDFEKNHFRLFNVSSSFPVTPQIHTYFNFNAIIVSLQLDLTL